MKKYILLFTYTFLFCNFSIYAQETISGNYEGVLQAPGMTLEMNLNLHNKNGTWIGDLDIPKQYIKNMALGELKISDNTISFSLPDVPGNAKYEGAIDNGLIVGKFSQGGSMLDLNFSKVTVIIDYSGYALRIRKLTDSILPIANVPGVGIAIVMKDQIILSDGFGFRNLEEEKVADGNTLFAIGSSSKAFTAAGVAKLVSEGKLLWDEPINNHIPEFVLEDEYATKKMNSIDILSHRSGLPRHDLLWYGTPFSRIELVKKLRHVSPNKSFRETWQYQNLMFMTAGILIEKISGKSWESYTQENILEPLGMTKTNFSVELMKQSTNAALPYRYDEENDSQIKLDYRNIDAIGPAGSINSSANEMVNWLKFQLNLGKKGEEEIINSGDFAKMHTPMMVMPRGPGFDGRSRMSYGLGWMIHTYNGIKVIEHGGNIDGFSAQVLLVPEKELGIVILSNRNGTPLPSLLSYEMVDIMLGNNSGGYLASVYKESEEDDEKSKEEEEEEEEVKTTQIKNTNYSKGLEEYSGSFSHQGYGDIKVSIEDGKLLAKYYSLDIPLEHYHFDVFEGELGNLGQDTKIQFHMDFDGEVVSLSTLMEPTMKPIIFEKAGNDKYNDKSYLSNFLGTYETPDLKLKVEFRNTKLYISPTGQPSYELIPISKNKFKPEGLPGFSIEFIVNNEIVTAAKLIQPNGVFTAKKLKE